MKVSKCVRRYKQLKNEETSPSTKAYFKKWKAKHNKINNKNKNNGEKDDRNDMRPKDGKGVCL